MGGAVHPIALHYFLDERGIGEVVVAAFARQQHVAQNDTRSVDLFTSEHVPHEVLIQVVKDLVVLQSRHDVVDDDLV